MISAVPTRSPVNSTTCARQTCFCGLFRSATTAASRSRSAAQTSSPRATLRSFMDACNEAYQLLHDEVELKKRRDTSRLNRLQSRILRHFDLSQEPELTRATSGEEAAVCLKEIFDRMNFGPDSAGIGAGAEHDYVTFIYGVLGAVIIGWMVALFMIARGPLRRREMWAWRTVAGSALVWFSIDTTFSLVVGQLEHAGFNLMFAIALAVPLTALRRRILLGSHP